MKGDGWRSLWLLLNHGCCCYVVNGPVGRPLACIPLLADCIRSAKVQIQPLHEQTIDFSTNSQLIASMDNTLCPPLAPGPFRRRWYVTNRDTQERSRRPTAMKLRYCFT